MATAPPPSPSPPPPPPAPPPPTAGGSSRPRSRGLGSAARRRCARARRADRRLPAVRRRRRRRAIKLEFAEAGQLVRGDQVQVGGVPVGSVTNIELTHDFKAIVTIHVDSSLTPLHARHDCPSPGAVAVERRQPLHRAEPRSQQRPRAAGGAKLPASATRKVTDLDQLFNTLNPKTRKGLQQFIQGTAEQYVGRGQQRSASRPNTSRRRSPRPITSSPSSCATSRRSRASSWKPPRP